MSVLVMSMVFQRYPHGGNERLLALALADHANDEGERIYPSVPTLASKTMLSERTVQRMVAKMVRDGWLELVRAANGRSDQGNHYRISKAWLEGKKGDKLTPFSDAPPVDNLGQETGKGDKLTPIRDGLACSKNKHKGDNHDKKGDTAMSPEPSEPSLLNTPLPPASGGASESFAEFLSSFPAERRLKTERAARRWEALTLANAALAGEMLAAVRQCAMAHDWPKERGRYAPTPDRWLRERRWLDVRRSAGLAAAVFPATRSGVEALGVELGHGRWDEAAFSTGQGERFSQYEARVKAAWHRRQAFAQAGGQAAEQARAAA